MLHLVVTLAASLGVIWLAFYRPLLNRTRWIVGMAWVAVGIAHLFGSGRFDRFIGLAVLASAVVVLLRARAVGNARV